MRRLRLPRTGRVLHHHQTPDRTAVETHHFDAMAVRSVFSVRLAVDRQCGLRDSQAAETRRWTVVGCQLIASATAVETPVAAFVPAAHSAAIRMEILRIAMAVCLTVVNWVVVRLLALAA